MADPVVRLTLGDAPCDPWTLAPPAAPWRDEDAVRDEVLAHATGGAGLVVLEGGDTAAWPGLARLAADARRAGAALALRGPIPATPPAVVRGRGVEIVELPWHGDAATHDACVGDGAHAATVAWLHATDRPRLRVVTGLSVTNATDVAAFGHAVATAAPHVERITLTGAVPGPLTHAARARALEAAWRATRSASVALALDAAHVAPDLAPAAPRALDAHLLALRAEGGWLPGLGGGVHAPGADRALCRRLHALGMPAIDAEGRARAPGLGRTPATGPIAVVVPHHGDGLLCLSTLPALVTALRDRGVDATLRSVWERPWNLHAPARGDLVAALGRHADPRRREVARQLTPRFLQRLDLTGVRRVLVPGFAAAHTLRHHPTLAPDAVVEVVDVHLLHGAEAWSPSPDGAWWPGDGVEVTACFPAYVENYRRLGVPVTALRWQPYPLARSALPAATGDGPILAAGNQRRDHDLLHAAATRLPADAREIRVISAGDVPPVPPLVHQAPVSAAELCAAIARARFVLLPVQPSAVHAAGITVAALALAMGRPVVGTTAWGLVDHVTHGVSGLLVAPDDPEALAAAIHRLDTDDALRDRLAAGARAAGAALDVTAWADALATGVDGQTVAWPIRTTRAAPTDA